MTDSNLITSIKALVTQQLSDLMKSEGFPTDDGWRPQYSIEENELGVVVVRFLDEKSKAWFRFYRKRIRNVSAG